ncbi:MAG TPA: hypothetical protein VFN60_13055 [Acidimicrobiales bacterium]|nr:hypothetical protein [Acidimicrobiales bacterium]
MPGIGDGSYETLRTGWRYRLACGPSGYVIEDWRREGQPVVEHYTSGLFDLALYRFEQLEAATPPPPPPPTPAGPPRHTAPAATPPLGGWPQPWPGTTHHPWTPTAPARFCRMCGTALVPAGSSCARCGATAGGVRDKSIAVGLAVFLAFWTWLYTYGRDKRKFWAGLALDIVGLALLTTGAGWMVLVGVWIWAIVATVSRPVREYELYGVQPGGGRPGHR